MKNINFIQNMNNTTAFINYVHSFDFDEHMIKLKLVHSIKVAKHCQHIAEDVFSNDKELVELAYNIGLLHDISRFKQWSTYETFIDRESFDHGDYSVDLLFNQNQIENFKIDKKWYPYLYISIKNHNKLKVAKAELKDFCSNYNIDFNLANTLCMMIRDADKLDISRVFIENPNNMDLSKTAIQGGYTKEMMNDFKAHHLCDYKNRKTIVDFALGYLAFPFDLNFKKSNEIFAEQADAYANSIKSRYYHKLNNAEDRTTLVDSCNYLSNYFEQFKTFDK